MRIFSENSRMNVGRIFKCSLGYNGTEGGVGISNSPETFEHKGRHEL